MREKLALLGLVVLVVGGGSLIGVFTPPGPWYAGLEKPPFNPPNWVFGPVWTFLYVLIAVAGWRICRADSRSLAMRLWWTQLALNFLWSPVFFSLQSPGLGLIVILALLAAIIGFMRAAAGVDRIAMWLFAPYLLWVAFATLLNLSIFILN